MLRRSVVQAAQPWWRTIANRSSSSKASISAAVNNILLRSLKEHYLEVSKMTPPPRENVAARSSGGGAAVVGTIARQSSLSLPKAGISSAINNIVLRCLEEHYLEVSKTPPPPKVSPPSPFTIVKGALDSSGPVLKRDFGDEEISLSVMRLANYAPEGGDDEDGDDINQLFLHVDISKRGQEQNLQFMCGLYPDALGIHSVAMRPKAETSGFVLIPNRYNGPTFQDLDENMRDALHGYIEERGINEELFQFLQAWLYVKDHRNLMCWFRSVATLVKQGNA